MAETLRTELWAPIDQQIHYKASEAQLHYLRPTDRQTGGAHSLQRVSVMKPNPQEALTLLNREEIPPDALLLWMDFTKHKKTGDRGTQKRPRYTSVQKSVGQLAVNIGSTEFQSISEIAALPELPPALRLWLSFYLLEKPHNHKRPLPHDLAELARQHNLDSERIEFRNQYDQENGPRVANYPYDSDNKDITRFTARYADYLLQTAGASDPTILQQPFWRAIEAQVTKTLEKR